MKNENENAKESEGRQSIPVDKLIFRLGQKDLEILLIQEQSSAAIKELEEKIMRLQKENSALTEENMKLKNT